MNTDPKNQTPPGAPSHPEQTQANTTPMTPTASSQPDTFGLYTVRVCSTVYRVSTVKVFATSSEAAERKAERIAERRDKWGVIDMDYFAADVRQDCGNRGGRYV